MADPTFKTREELEAWAGKTAREAQAHYCLGERTAILEGLDYIKRVTLAHSHLLGDKP